MPDYSKGKIYTIRNREDDTLIYVGSTIQSLSVRFSGHKGESLKGKNINIKLYKTVNNNWENWCIELYENFPCNCREELLKKEGEIIRLIGNLNTQIAGRTSKEYHIDNAKKLKELYKRYHINNLEKIKEYKKQYRIDNLEKIKEYIVNNAEKIKEQRKEYLINNAEKIKEQKKQYYINKKNKEN